MSTLLCSICGNPIDPNSRRTKYCSDECANKGNAQHSKKNGKLARERKAKEKKSKAKPKRISLDNTLKEIAKYNKKNGTNISYGQYSRMMGL